MSRILIATRTPKELPGGSGFHLRNMIACLEAGGYSCGITHFTSGNWDSPPFIGERETILPTMRAQEPKAIIADYSWMADILDSFEDDVLKICFVHDLRCRIIPCLEKIGYKDTRGWTEKKEAHLLRKADILLVLNEVDAEFCRRMAPNAKTIRIGIALDPISHDPAKEVPGRCIYVGSRVMENQYAIKWFGGNVWPEVIKEVPHAMLDIVYGHPDDIDERYARAQLAMVPHVMDGGLKIKTAEAIQHGVPPIGNVCAADGIGEVNGWFMDDPKEMAEKIVLLLKNQNIREFGKWKRLETLTTKMTPQAAYGELLKAIA